VLGAAVMVLSACVGPLRAPAGSAGGVPAAPTGSPGALPEPIPGRGLGGSLPSGAPQVELRGVEFRPDDHPEDAAVRYTLHLANDGPAPVIVRMDHNKVRATDDAGRPFEDFWSQAQRNNAAGCTCTGCRLPDFTRLTSLAVPLAPGASRDVMLYLNPVGAPGNCEKGGRARARVEPGTASIQVALPEISYGFGPSEPLRGVTLTLEP